MPCKDKDRKRKYSRNWGANNKYKIKQYNRKHGVKHKYGITTEQWDALFAMQGSCCGVCKSPDPGRKTGHWSTDHDHVTGKVRGILCNGCNVALGQVNDDPNRLRMLAEYLEKEVGSLACIKA